MTFTLQVSANGNVLCSEIVGSIKMRVFLSGMPELRLGLNDKVLFENTGRESTSSSFCPHTDAKRPLWHLKQSFMAFISRVHALSSSGCVFYSFVESDLSSSGGKSKSVELEDVKFHQCVRLSRFENDRTISFIPPDGEFELMSYRLNTHVRV